jgi:hypothetical protein
MTKLEQKQKEYIEYLIKCISTESIIKDISAGARAKYESEISALEQEAESQPQRDLDAIIENQNNDIC